MSGLDGGSMAQPPQGGERVLASRVLLALLLSAAVVPALWTAALAVWHLPQPVYRLTPGRVAVTTLAAGAVLLGARLLWARPRPWLTVGGLLVPVLWVLAVLGAASIGILVLPVAAVATAVLAVLSRRAGGGAGGAAAAGLLVAVGLGVLLIARPGDALVRCGQGSVATSGRVGESSSSGSAASSPGGGSGRIEVDGAAYVYRCEGASLVEFRRVD